MNHVMAVESRHYLLRGTSPADDLHWPSQMDAGGSCVPHLPGDHLISNSLAAGIGSGASAIGPGH